MVPKAATAGETMGVTTVNSIKVRCVWVTSLSTTMAAPLTAKENRGTCGSAAVASSGRGCARMVLFRSMRGALTTQPLSFSGKHLFVNGDGSVQVDVLGLNRRALASAVVAGDSLRHRVVFQGKSLREVAGADGARLRFTIREGGRLYSFKIE